MRGHLAILVTTLVAVTAMPSAGVTQEDRAAPEGANRIVTEMECVAPSLVATIAPKAIGEPVRSVTLQAAWVAATDTVAAHCRVDGVFAPVDTAPTARVINFSGDPAGVVDPPGAADWRRRHQRHYPEPAVPPQARRMACLRSAPVRPQDACALPSRVVRRIGRVPPLPRHVFLEAHRPGRRSLELDPASATFLPAVRR